MLDLRLLVELENIVRGLLLLRRLVLESVQIAELLLGDYVVPGPLVHCVDLHLQLEQLLNLLRPLEAPLALAFLAVTVVTALLALAAL